MRLYKKTQRALLEAEVSHEWVPHPSNLYEQLLRLSVDDQSIVLYRNVYENPKGFGIYENQTLNTEIAVRYIPLFIRTEDELVRVFNRVSREVKKRESLPFRKVAKK